jgi:hypothetical protein
MPIWKKHVTASAAFLEVTHNAQTGWWHPHIHAITTGTYIPQHQLSAAWLTATHDSQIVHITLVRQPQRIANYVTKYVTKPLTFAHDIPPEQLAEAIRAFAGTRLCTTTGTWSCLLYTSPSPRDRTRSRMPSSA